MDTPIYKVYEVNKITKKKVLISIWTSLKKMNLWMIHNDWHYYNIFVTNYATDVYENWNLKIWKNYYLQVEEIWDWD